MRRGFTLLEMMVAVGVFALVSSMSYAALGRALACRDRLEEERRFWNSLSAALLRLQEDVGQACPRSVRGPDGRRRAALLAEGGELELTRWRAPLEASDSPGLERVAFRLSEGTLWRASLPLAERASILRVRPVPLLSGVSNFRLRFRSSSGMACDRWPPAAVESGLEELPARIEITVDMGGRGEFRRQLAPMP